MLSLHCRGRVYMRSPESETALIVLRSVANSEDMSAFTWRLLILSEADSHFHKHMHQLQNPLISIMLCHKSYSWAASPTVIIAEQEAEVCD